MGSPAPLNQDDAFGTDDVGADRRLDTIGLPGGHGDLQVADPALGAFDEILELGGLDHEIGPSGGELRRHRLFLFIF